MMRGAFERGGRHEARRRAGPQVIDECVEIHEVEFLDRRASPPSAAPSPPEAMKSVMITR